jgi:hypothetical protein
MRLFHKIFTIAFLASAAGFPGLAQAADVPAAIQAFLANLERQTAAKPSYEALKDDGNGQVTITNLTLSKPEQGEDPAVTLKIGEAGFSGISEEGAAHYLIGKANFANSSISFKGQGADLTISIPTVDVEGWHIRTTSATPTSEEELLASTTYAKQMSTGKVTITAGGQAISIDGINTNWAGDPDTGSGTYTMKVDNIALPAALVAQMDPGGMLKQLGYNELNLDLTTEGDLTRNGDKLGYAFNLGLTGRNIATLRLGASLGEVPLAAYVDVLQAQTEGQELNLDNLMPQLQNTLLKGADLRFEDASILKKALPLIAAMQGIDEKTLIASIPPMVQLQLIQLQNEAFTKQAVDAVTAFLNDPKSITFSLKPPAPLTFATLTTLNMARPGDAVTKLGLTVTAND